MKAAQVLAIIAITLSAGCIAGVLKPEVEVEAVNRSSHQLQNVEAHFGVHVCGWGYLVPSATKSYLSFPHTITDEATVMWDESGRHHIEKVELRGIYAPSASGRLTFTLFDDHVVATFQKQ